MNRNEVKVWQKYHGELFPEFQVWYDKHSTASRAVFFESSCKAFKAIDLGHATEASDRMLSGTVKRPFRDEDVVASIVTEAGKVRSQQYAQSRPRTADGQTTYACHYCRDGGYVECWMLDLKSTMMVCCSCQTGNRVAEGWRRHSGQVPQQYDTKKCYRVGDESAHWISIRGQVERENTVDPSAWPPVYRNGRRLRVSEAKEDPQPQQSNHESAFDAFSTVGAIPEEF